MIYFRSNVIYLNIFNKDFMNEIHSEIFLIILEFKEIHFSCELYFLILIVQ